MLDPSGDDSSSDEFETVPTKGKRIHTSSDEFESVPIPSKRMRLNTYGASSTTSQGSGKKFLKLVYYVPHFNQYSTLLHI